MPQASPAPTGTQEVFSFLAKPEATAGLMRLRFPNCQANSQHRCAMNEPSAGIVHSFLQGFLTASGFFPWTPLLPAPVPSSRVGSEPVTVPGFQELLASGPGGRPLTHEGREAEH